MTVSSNTEGKGFSNLAIIHPAITSLARFVSVFLLFASTTAVFFWEWLPDLHSALIGPPEDNMQDFWNTWYVAFTHSPGRFFSPT